MKPQKKSFFSNPATKSKGKGRATKKKNFLKLEKIKGSEKNVATKFEGGGGVKAFVAGPLRK